MDKRPKRSRDKYNPYTLHSEKAKNIYRVTFSNQNKTINIAITKEIFDELDENEKEDRLRKTGSVLFKLRCILRTAHRISRSSSVYTELPDSQ